MHFYAIFLKIPLIRRFFRLADNLCLEEKQDS